MQDDVRAIGVQGTDLCGEVFRVVHGQMYDLAGHAGTIAPGSIWTATAVELGA